MFLGSLQGPFAGTSSPLLSVPDLAPGRLPARALDGAVSCVKFMSNTTLLRNNPMSCRLTAYPS